MKRTFIFLLSIFLTLSSLAQIPYQYIGVNNNRVIARGQFKADSALILPGVSVVNYKAPGMLRYDASDSSVYVYSGFNWIKVGPGAGGSSDSTIFATRYWTSTQYQPIDTYLKTGTNGLTSTGTNVKLGGTLSENTTINTNGNRFTINSGSSDPKYSFDFSSSGIYIGKTNSGNHWVSVDDNEASMYYVSGPYENTGVSVRADSVFLQKYDNFTTPKKQVFAPTTTDTSSFQILAINKTTGSLVRYTGAWPSPTDISGKLNISDTTGKFIGSGWLTTLAAKQTQLNGTGFVKASGTTITYDNSTYTPTSMLTDSLNANGVTGITLNTPNVVFSTPINFSKTGRSWSGTLALNNQSANRVFAGPTTGSAAAPTFRNLDTADFGGNFYSQVRGVAGVDSGWTDYSSTSTVTGWSSFTNKIIRYAVIGNIVHVHFFILGTSNSTTTSFTLPISISSNLIATEIEVPCRIFNNGTPALGFFRNENSTTIGAYSTITGSSWTASGTKLISGDFYYEKD